jgi:hypothetical protein
MYTPRILRSLTLAAILCGSFIAAAAQAPKAAVPPIEPIATTDTDVANTREELLRLLKISPTLTEVIAADPSLLANQEYVNRNNPELGRFLQAHPEVARNPDFYLFADLPHNGRSRGESLERRIWRGAPEPERNSSTERLMNEVGPFFVFVIFMGALIWLIRVMLANRRWGRIFKLQTEVHGKLIDKLGSTPELLNYMETDAGKRFLEAAPIPVDFEKDDRLPAILSRVLLPLSVGIVLTLLGIGLLFLRHSLLDEAEPLLVLGTVALMPGIGFIIAAGITWLLASRLGLMPAPVSTNEVTYTKERL